MEIGDATTTYEVNREHDSSNEGRVQGHQCRYVCVSIIFPSFPTRCLPEDIEILQHICNRGRDPERVVRKRTLNHVTYGSCRAVWVELPSKRELLERHSKTERVLSDQGGVAVRLRQVRTFNGRPRFLIGGTPDPFLSSCARYRLLASIRVGSSRKLVRVHWTCCCPAFFTPWCDDSGRATPASEDRFCSRISTLPLLLRFLSQAFMDRGLAGVEGGCSSGY